MPRLKHKLPSYCRHKASGQAVVTIDGRDVFCFSWNWRIGALARAGASEMLMAAMNEEVDACLGRGRYARDAAFRGYRNGTMPRRLTLGSGTVELKQPRVRDVPPDQEPYESKIIRKYQHRSDTIDETFVKLFIEGLATRDFEPALRMLVGEEAPLRSACPSSRRKQRRPGHRLSQHLVHKMGAGHR